MLNNHNNNILGGRPVAQLTMNRMGYMQRMNFPEGINKGIIIIMGLSTDSAGTVLELKKLLLGPEHRRVRGPIVIQGIIILHNWNGFWEFNMLKNSLNLPVVSCGENLRISMVLQVGGAKWLHSAP